MKICCKLPAILFKVLLSYLKYFIASKAQKEHWWNIASSCMEPACRRGYLRHTHTEQSILRLLRQNCLFGSPERKAETRYIYTHKHRYHGHYRESIKKFKTWSFGAKYLCPLLPVLRLLHHQREFCKMLCRRLSLVTHAASTCFAGQHCMP